MLQNKTYISGFKCNFLVKLEKSNTLNSLYYFLNSSIYYCYIINLVAHIEICTFVLYLVTGFNIVLCLKVIIFENKISF